MEGEDKIGSDQPNIGDKGAGSAVMLSPAGDRAGALAQVGPLAQADTLTNAADSERNTVFSTLVREDGDIVGLVAYSIYKQNKVDWLDALQKAHGRGPSDAELNAYIIGESTPRRLAIYRHLAAATLAGNGPGAEADGAWINLSSSSVRQADVAKPAANWLISSVLSYALLAAAILIGVWLVARYGVPAR